MELNFTTYFPFYDSRLPHQPIEIRPNGIVFWNGKEIESGEEFKQAMVEISKILIAEFNGKNKFFDWQPIETAPKDGTEILVTGWDDNGINTTRYYAACQYIKSCEGFVNLRDSLCYGVLTHWMPLPESPEYQQQSSGEVQHHPV